MIIKDQRLTSKIFTPEIQSKSIRDGFGEALLELGRNNSNVVVLTADLKDSTRVKAFADEFPERFFDVGVAEQGMATVASGLASYGKLVFATSFAVFSPGRNWEQIRTTIAINNVPVKIVGTHTGFSAVLDGTTHQALEDIAIMRVLPNMEVVVPGDFEEAKKAVVEIAKNQKPTYLRLLREETPIFTTPNTPFKLGKSNTLWADNNPQVAIIACGSMVYQSLLAARALGERGIECLVINNHTIKPMDTRTIINAAKIAGCVVTVEEHQVSGGMGSAVAEVLAQNFPVPMEIIGVKDSFGESGKYEELLEKHGLTSENIIKTVKEVLERKTSTEQI